MTKPGVPTPGFFVPWFPANSSVGRLWRYRSAGILSFDVLEDIFQRPHGVSMADVSKPSRPWRVVATEVTQETDSKKLAQLIEELNRVLEDQVRDHSDGPASNPKTQ